MGLALTFEPIRKRTPRRGSAQVYRPYAGPDRPCEHCGPNGSHKRAIFYDTRRKHYLCARCTVAKIEARPES